MNKDIPNAPDADLPPPSDVEEKTMKLYRSLKEQGRHHLASEVLKFGLYVTKLEKHGTDRRTHKNIKRTK